MARFAQPIVLVILLNPFLSFAQESSMPTTYTIDLAAQRQTIRNFGSSTGMHGGYIAKRWPRKVVNQMAEWVFSRENDSSGQPKGIGLSAFRVQIGAGTIDQDGIHNDWRRTECYQRPDGSYDWDQSAGETWWIEKAREYGVETVIGYSNSPPITFTKNGLGYRTKDVPSGNLKDDCYDDFAEFLATVAEHLDLDYVCPVNEPQWGWLPEAKGAKQEGSQWHNREIKRLAIELNRALESRGLKTRILIPEAGGLGFLWKKNWRKPWDNQLRFFEQGADLYVGDLSRIAPVIAGHGYGSDKNPQGMIDARVGLRERVDSIKPGIEYWQTEYSLLDDGFREGRKQVSKIEGALFLAKNIHVDLTVGNAAAWQFWASFNADRVWDPAPRFTLIGANSPTDCLANKNLWALGHFSRFVRSGMRRVEVTRGDGLEPVETLMKDMASAFVDPASSRLVVVLINYEKRDKRIRLAVKNADDNIRFKPYMTTEDAGADLAPLSPVALDEDIYLPGQTIVTLDQVLE